MTNETDVVLKIAIFLMLAGAFGMILSFLFGEEIIFSAGAAFAGFEVVIYYLYLKMKEQEQELGVDPGISIFKRKAKSFWDKYKILILGIFIVWFVFTGGNWLFAEKTVYSKECTVRPVRYVQWDYFGNGSYENTSYVTYDEKFCYPVKTTRHYTLIETIGLEGKMIRDSFGWITSHRVI